MAPFRFAFQAMTTRCELQLYGLPTVEAQQLAERIVSRVQALQLRYNFHAADSWLSRTINQRGSNRIELDAECSAVLATVHRHSALSGGAFDITVGTYSQALKKADTLAAVQAIRQQWQAYTGLQRWWLEGDALLFDNPHTCFDLGGVIKEYAVDEACRLASSSGASAGLINFGGDLACFGRKPDGQRFIAAVPNPQQPGLVLFGLDLENQALTTSAHYARRRQLADGALSHVVTADLANAAWLSASVVSSSALLSGIYSTALLTRAQTPLPDDVLAVVVDRQLRAQALAPRAAG